MMIPLPGTTSALAKLYMAPCSIPPESLDLFQTINRMCMQTAIFLFQDRAPLCPRIALSSNTSSVRQLVNR
ncbi:hypothetical protein N7510_002600 [Penicillium lagena]|uniref:uncharacterized protein n=1 Tax=Penicillium lagena TaxID=94218 RepID=UPI0025408D97|nr:uncharacterized protein N7510_002600 [Penicillium lagena]KAJ5626291.1 hypothetical protein N7510_002600 [Penicillium lagena]